MQHLNQTVHIPNINSVISIGQRFAGQQVNVRALATHKQDVFPDSMQACTFDGST